MKKVGFGTCAVILMALWCFSCSKENAGPGYYPATFGYKAESVYYSGGLAYAFYTDSTHSLHAEFYDNPVQYNYVFIDFSAPGYPVPGVYPVGYDTARQTTVNMQYFTDASHAFTSVSGNLTITACDTLNQRISGTFQFNGQNQGAIRRITQGSFDKLNYLKR